jgi:rod shape-determining protein MreC
MQKQILDNKFFIALFVIFGLLFLHYTTILRPLEKGLTIIFSPFQNVFYTASNETNQKISAIKEQKDLKKNNKELSARIEKLEQKIIELKLFIEEKDLLIKQDKYLEQEGFHYLNARVISASSESNPNIIVINRGESNGVKKGMAVTGENGTLIGKIIKVSSNTSHVRLIIDNSSKVSASIAGISQINGIVEGNYNLSLTFKNILKKTNLKEGDLIMTSGYDENIPAGILIGKVEEIYDSSQELFKSAVLFTNINFHNLRIVNIIIE